ncbi:hypothetical protein [Pontibacter arcticus]|uniref:Uncharacterized protein n=1 Tax=Pontibacter arcticus TaxID=2080288 RepID=A0A364RBZ0_9BACT|nr:hypothetical protein [Pontibacter arcticus]RAU81775.1 hypothetical protein DP923_13825 [Pontibacter arcticus]
MPTNANLKPNERELMKLIRFFSKRAVALAQTGELTEDHSQLTNACQNLETQLYMHAENRAAILDKRERLQRIIEENAQCPKCGKADMLKKNGVATNEHGWKSNTYRCRRCNTTFTWNRPNNPWHMAEFLEVYMKQLEENASKEVNEEVQAHIAQALANMQESLDRLRPVLQISDEEVAALEEKELEMDKMIHQFKNYLLIEKIKLDTWQDPK